MEHRLTFNDTGDFQAFIDAVLKVDGNWNFRKYLKFRKAVTAWHRAGRSEPTSHQLYLHQALTSLLVSPENFPQGPHESIKFPWETAIGEVCSLR